MRVYILYILSRYLGTGVDTLVLWLCSDFIFSGNYFGRNVLSPMISFEFAVDIHAKTGAHIVFVNLSGGVGIPYTPDQEPNDIFVIGDGVRKVYEEIFK